MGKDIENSSFTKTGEPPAQKEPKLTKKEMKRKVKPDSLHEFIVRMQLIDPDIKMRRLSIMSGYPEKTIEEILCSKKFEDGIREQIKVAERDGEKKLVIELREKLIDAKMARKKALGNDEVVAGELLHDTKQALMTVKNSEIDPKELLFMMESLVKDGVFIAYKYVKGIKDELEEYEESKGTKGAKPSAQEVMVIEKLTGESFKRTLIMRGRTLEDDKPIQSLLETIDGGSKDLVAAE
jgi:hypothetical protein